MFPNQEAARIYLEKQRWGKKAECPHCQSKERITTRKGGYYRCNACKKDFTVRTGTIFERSHIPLHKWMFGMYIVMTARKGISSLQLSKEIGITQKSAWFMLHRIREACSDDGVPLTGIVEVDESCLGGKEKNRHQWKRKGLGTGTAGKVVVLGMREREGRTKAVVIEGTDAVSIATGLGGKVSLDATLHTDEARAYGELSEFFQGHETVNHSADEYVTDEGVTTNGIESVWAVLKRGIYGVYHHISEKHTNRYLDEFAFRLSDGNVEVKTLDRMKSLVAGGIGKRLTYKRLIA